MIGRTVVFTTSSDVEAALVSGLLEAEGLEAAIERSPLRSVFPVPIAFFGQLRITVPAAVADEARELLARAVLILDREKMNLAAANADMAQQLVANELAKGPSGPPERGAVSSAPSR